MNVAMIWKVLFKIVCFHGSFRVLQTSKFPRLLNWAKEHVQGGEAYCVINGLEKIKMEEIFKEEGGVNQWKDWGAI